MEKILPILKFLFFNFDYFLSAIIILLFIFIKDNAKFRLKDEIIKTGGFIGNLFNKLAAVKTEKLLISFFIINFLIRFLMILNYNSLLAEARLQSLPIFSLCNQ